MWGVSSPPNAFGVIEKSGKNIRKRRVEKCNSLWIRLGIDNMTDVPLSDGMIASDRQTLLIERPLDWM
jgi:hypothetical protein